MNTLFEHVSVVTMDDKDRILQNAYVYVKDETISYIGSERPSEKADRIIDGKYKVMLPGLINAHTHLPMSLLRGYADNCELDEWLNKYIFPAEGRMDRRSVTAAVDLSLAEMIANGITCYADMYDYCDVMAEQTVKCGISANIARGVVCFDEAAFDPNTYYSLVEQRDLLQWQNAGNGRIKIDASVHGEYTSSPLVWRYQSEWAKKHDLGMHIHLAETLGETEACRKNRGKSPVKALCEEGVFDTRTIAAHCVWLDDEDRELLAEKDVNVVHCPISNCKLGSGIADLVALQKKNINIALGTDGVSSNNSHDLFEEIKAAALLARAMHRSSSAVSALAALKMATCDAAKALGRETGILEEGRPADLILVDLDKPSLTPCHDIISNLVFSARGSDVCLTMSRGRIVYENGDWKTIDVEKAKDEIRSYGVPVITGQTEAEK